MEIFVKCAQCNGTGEYSQGSGIHLTSNVCNWPGCVNGFIPFGNIDSSDISDKLDDVLDKCNDILEQISG